MNRPIRKLRANEATGLEVVGPRSAQGYPVVVICDVDTGILMFLNI